jgi:hypothetical protein
MVVVLTRRLIYAVAEGSVLVRGIMGSPAPASMWTGWSWQPLHTTLETLARRFALRVVSDAEAERVIGEAPEIRIDTGEISVTWRPPHRRADRPGSRALERAQRGADRLTV